MEGAVEVLLPNVWFFAIPKGGLDEVKRCLLWETLFGAKKLGRKERWLDGEGERLQAVHLGTPI